MGEVRRFEWTVTPRQAGARLDHFLTDRGALGSRSRIRRLLDAGAIRVDGAVPKPGRRLRAGERVTVEEPVENRAGPEPEPMGLAVLHEDAEVLCIDKPAGLVVHPAPGHARGTLVHGLLHYLGGEAARAGLDPERLGLVHRLDKETSGVLVVAKTAAALAALGAQFRRREVEKRYLALAWGRFERRAGRIIRPIARHPVHRKKMAVAARGREAVTRFEVLEQFRRAALVAVFPATGRTHQIRVHLSAIGHPVVGDRQYGRGRQGPIRRHALHAEAIAFRHPVTGERIEVRAPLPEDFREALRFFRCEG